MTMIGNFEKRKNGVFQGQIQTLMIERTVEFRPTEATNDKAPAFRIFLADSGVEIGAAWEKKSQQGNAYLSVSIDDPSFSAPLYASLTKRDDGTYSLWWDRPSAKASTKQAA